MLLRGEMTVSDLREIIRSVKPRVDVPVTYADVWEFWLRYREIGADVDFVTVHFLPYWEDIPVSAEDAAAHVDQVRMQVAAAFPGKDILIGETGWPSHGRMRAGALPSRINQARFTSEILTGPGGKTFASICSRPMTSRGSAAGKVPWEVFGACSTGPIAR